MLKAVEFSEMVNTVEFSEMVDSKIKMRVRMGF